MSKKHLKSLYEKDSKTKQKIIIAIISSRLNLKT